MMTVRFATGFSVQYNDATYAERNGLGYTDLFSAKGGRWIAQFPTALCLLEVTYPCRMYNPISQANERIESAVDQLTRKVKTLTTRVGKLKA